MGKGQDLYKKAKTLIPGGTMLLSKRPEMFLPEYWPSYFSKAKIAIYPNPANQKQTMVIQSATPQSLNIDLYDISGQLIKNVYAGKACIGEQQFDVDISNISNGIYFYKVSIGDSELHYKFIKQ